MRLDMAFVHQGCGEVGPLGVLVKIINTRDNAAMFNPGIAISRDGSATICDRAVPIAHSSNHITVHTGETDTFRGGGRSSSFATAKSAFLMLKAAELKRRRLTSTFRPSGGKPLARTLRATDTPQTDGRARRQNLRSFRSPLPLAAWNTT